LTDYLTISYQLSWFVTLNESSGEMMYKNPEKYIHSTVYIYWPGLIKMSFLGN
jgi:hypothetical protein